MRIARAKDASLRDDLLKAVLAGESSREVRARIAATKDPASTKRGEGKAPHQPAGPLIFTFTETYEGCTATVRGPEGKDARRYMRTALKRLLKQL